MKGYGKLIHVVNSKTSKVHAARPADAKRYGPLHYWTECGRLVFLGMDSPHTNHDSDITGTDLPYITCRTCQSIVRAAASASTLESQPVETAQT